MASPNLSELVTTTLSKYSRTASDNVTKNNALFYRVNKRGNVRTFDGGRNIVQELEYAENGTFKRYSGYEQLNIAPSDVFTAAEFPIAQAAVAVTISGLEQLQNRGTSQIIDLLEGRIKNAMRTMTNNIAQDIYSDGSADGGKQIGGLQLLVSKTPTLGTVGGIDRSQWAFWRNQAYAPSGAPTAVNIKSRMNTIALACSRGTDRPDLILADNNYYQAYLESLQAIQQITKTDMAAAGFTSLAFAGHGSMADVVFDGGQGGACPANTMYFINTDFIHFRPHADRNFVPIGGDRQSVNQDAIVKLLGFAGNMTLSNASLQGVLSHS